MIAVVVVALKPVPPMELMKLFKMIAWLLDVEILLVGMTLIKIQPVLKQMMALPIGNLKEKLTLYVRVHVNLGVDQKIAVSLKLIPALALSQAAPRVDDPTPTPTSNPTSVIISGNIQYDNDAAAAGTFCSQSVTDGLDVSGYKVTVTNTDAPSTSYGTTYTDENWYVNTKSSGSTYTVTLDLSNQTGDTTYVCSCPAPIDPENPYLCRYTGVTSPSSSVNFYLKEYDLSNGSWFQVFGGNLFARYGIADVIPYAFCSLYSNCQAALSVPLTTSTNQLSSGFAVTNTSSTNSVISSDIVGYTHSFLHLADRTYNVGAYAVNTGLNQLSYSYFL